MVPSSGADAVRRVAVVTGGSRGIGAATAVALAKDGHDVLLTYAHRPERADEVVAACLAYGVTATAVAADFAQPGPAARAVFAALGQRHGRLDVLVNNAGVLPQPAPTPALDEDRLLHTMTVNAVGPALCSALAVRLMSRAGGGRGGVIVNVSSRAAEKGGPGEFVDYAMSKGAVDVLTHGLGLEVGAEGIRVVGVRPGLIDTDMNAAIPGRLARLEHTIPLGRVGTPEEVAEVIAWLASPSAGYITGITIDVSGGR